MRNIAVLGATGSIGQSSLSVISDHPERFQVYALCANGNVDRLFDQCQEHSPRFAVLVEGSAAEQLAKKLKRAGSETEVLAGTEALEQIASDEGCDTVIAAIVGAAGLPSALAAAKAGKRILLANKESLVMAGEIFMAAVANSGAQLLPIDSEHNAIFQCLDQQDRGGVEGLSLTASGGPFRTWEASQLATVTPAQAVKHPNWSMGAKVSVDSATLMNKGLELIEAAWLFDMPSDQIDILVHPQSVVHSFVHYADGSSLAQLGSPDMRTPIAYGLGYPDRVNANVPRLDLAALQTLEFEHPDTERFPCLDLARQAFAAGGQACVTLNAANEVAVAEFLAKNIRFLDIPRLVEHCLEFADTGSAVDVSTLFVQDRLSRAHALSWTKKNKSK